MPDPDPLILAPEFDDELPVYPANFVVPDRQPYGFAVDMGLARSDFSAGNARQRRTFSVMPHAITLSFGMRIEELYLWQNWANAFAFRWFHCPVSTMYAGGPPEPGNLRHEILRFTSDLRVQMEGWNFVQVTCTAELSGDAYANDPHLGAGGWIIGGTPAEPSPDWLIGGTPASPSASWAIAGTPALPASLI